MKTPRKALGASVFLLAVSSFVILSFKDLTAQASTSVHIDYRAPTATSQFAQVAIHVRTLTPSEAFAADKTATPGLVSADKTMLTFPQKMVRLVVHTGPENDMLSYRINGLRNPILKVAHGATLKILFVNNDGDMFHNIRFGAYNSKFPNEAASLIKTSVGSLPIPHAAGLTIHASEFIIKAPTHRGKYAYFCTMRGHAQGGMWGTVLVR